MRPPEQAHLLPTTYDAYLNGDGDPKKHLLKANLEGRVCVECPEFQDTAFKVFLVGQRSPRSSEPMLAAESHLLDFSVFAHKGFILPFGSFKLKVGKKRWEIEASLNRPADKKKRLEELSITTIYSGNLSENGLSNSHLLEVLSTGKHIFSVVYQDFGTERWWVGEERENSYSFVEEVNQLLKRNKLPIKSVNSSPETFSLMFHSEEIIIPRNMLLNMPTAKLH